jgi:hypothetical protein
MKPTNLFVNHRINNTGYLNLRKSRYRILVNGEWEIYQYRLQRRTRFESVSSYDAMNKNLNFLNISSVIWRRATYQSFYFNEDEIAALLVLMAEKN